MFTVTLISSSYYIATIEIRNWLEEHIKLNVISIITVNTNTLDEVITTITYRFGS